LIGADGLDCRYALTLPVLAAGLTGGEVVEVHVAVGQTIQRDEPVFTVETERFNS
jgi:pyruvate/2-oxoglutarate dehydrogenase complex dihydrolipoamide acyltransferase (E2) component